MDSLQEIRAYIQDHKDRWDGNEEHLLVHVDLGDLEDFAARIAALEAALVALTDVAGEFSFRAAGPHWDALCRVRAEARALLPQDQPAAPLLRDPEPTEEEYRRAHALAVRLGRA